MISRPAVRLVNDSVLCWSRKEASPVNVLSHPEVIRQSAVIIITLMAVCTDLRWRRIPNVLTVGAAVGALFFHALTVGYSWSHVFSGMGTGLIVFLPAFLLGGMGGGDIKLMGALGAWLGGWCVFETALWTAFWGGIIALGILVACGGWRRILRIPGDIAALALLRTRVQPAPDAPAFPYSLAIFAGLMTALVGKAIL